MFDATGAQKSENWSDFQSRYGKEGSYTKLILAASGNARVSGSSSSGRRGGVVKTLSNSTLLMMAAAVPGGSDKSISTTQMLRRSPSGPNIKRVSSGSSLFLKGGGQVNSSNRRSRPRSHPTAA